MKELWFIHLPKAGGVFIRNYFKESDVVKMFPITRAHDGISQIKNYEDYYTFGFVRNPWEYRVATYFYPQRINKDSWLGKYPTFEMYIKTTGGSDYLQSIRYKKLFCIKDKMVMNYIGKLETLYEDVNKILKINNLKLKISMNIFYKNNKNNVEIINNSSHEHYSTYYTDELIDIVYKQEKEIIELYDYKFERKG